MGARSANIFKSHSRNPPSGDVRGADIMHNRCGVCPHPFLVSIYTYQKGRGPSRKVGYPALTIFAQTRT